MNTNRVVPAENELGGMLDDSPPAAKAGDVFALQADLAAAKRALLQLGADFDAYKEKIQSQSPKQFEAEKESILREILPSVDLLKGTLNATASVQDQKPREDIQIALHHLYQLLNHHGIEPTNDIGKPFDPLWHEIVAEKCDPTKPENTILHVAECGYQRGGEVFRPAKVTVNVLTEPSVGDGS